MVAVIHQSSSEEEEEEHNSVCKKHSMDEDSTVGKVSGRKDFLAENPED